MYYDKYEDEHNHKGKQMPADREIEPKFTRKVMIQ